MPDDNAYFFAAGSALAFACQDALRHYRQAGSEQHGSVHPWGHSCCSVYAAVLRVGLARYQSRHAQIIKGMDLICAMESVEKLLRIAEERGPAHFQHHVSGVVFGDVCDGRHKLNICFRGGQLFDPESEMAGCVGVVPKQLWESVLGELRGDFILPETAQPFAESARIQEVPGPNEPWEVSHTAEQTRSYSLSSVHAMCEASSDVSGVVGFPDVFSLVRLGNIELKELAILRRRSDSPNAAKQAAHLLSQPSLRLQLVRDGFLTKEHIEHLCQATCGQAKAALVAEISQLLEFKLLKYREYQEHYCSLAAINERGSATVATAQAVLSRDATAHCLLSTEVVRCLRSSGAAVIRGALDPQVLRRLTWEMEGLDRSGHFLAGEGQACNPGALSNLLGIRRALPQNPTQGSATARELLAPEFVSACPSVVQAVEILQGLCSELQAEFSELPAIAVPCETLLTSYPPGAVYRRHLDSFGEHDNRRVVSLVLYANASWQSSWGGELRWWPSGDGPLPSKTPREPLVESDSEKCQPIGGDIVVMWSRAVWHEIMQVRGSVRRYALVQWLWKA